MTLKAAPREHSRVQMQPGCPPVSSCSAIVPLSIKNRSDRTRAQIHEDFFPVVTTILVLLLRHIDRHSHRIRPSWGCRDRQKIPTPPFVGTLNHGKARGNDPVSYIKIY